MSKCKIDEELTEMSSLMKLRGEPLA